ncbi:MAG: DNA mismatch repair endonuclease MutL [Candidatus Binatia bacterium]
MGRIHLLDSHTVEQIRAGEVIERPASIVKELVENAIDAGARTIAVRITRGGIDELVVQDDGEGMSPEDAELAVQRHATSKIATSGDLFALSTLGFRGEALASIAAVTQCEILTRRPEASEGVRVKVAGGAAMEVSPAAAPVGTTVTVRHVFFNTPPRRAFLKSPTAEGSQIEDVMIGLALSRQDLRFVFTWDQREVFDAVPHELLSYRVKAVLGKEWAQNLIVVPEEDPELADGGILVQGVIGPPDRHKNTRTGQYFFVNRRLIKSQSVSFAFSRGYGELLPAGRFPLGVLFLSVPPHTVDVNVHPTKREVKFQDERAVLHVVVHRVRAALDQSNLFRTVSPAMSTVPAPAPSIAVSPDIPIPDPADYPRPRRPDGPSPEPPLRMVPKPPPQPPIQPSPLKPATQPALWRRPDGTEFRIVGQSHELFVLVEVEGELWVVDQHAAHERVVYEQVLTSLHQQHSSSQPLLLPVTFELTPSARAGLEEMLGYLTTVGFDIQPFGGNTYQVQATPSYFRPSDTADLIVELAQARAEGRSDNSVQAKQEDLAARIACKVKAVKAGQVLTAEAMKNLISMLLVCKSPFVCPHGRPTMVRLPVQQLAAQFDRR